MVSGRQLKAGFPSMLREHPLTDSGNHLKLLSFKVYMMIPFLWEIRATMDWTVERTSLDLASYLQLEDVYTGLCLVRANLYKRRFKKGKPQPVHNRIFQGCGLVVALVTLTVGPLYLFSSANPFYDTNKVIIASLEFRLSTALHGDKSGGHFPLGSVSRFSVQDAGLSLLDTTFQYYQCIQARRVGSSEGVSESCGYSYLISRRDGADFQLLRFLPTSDSIWGINEAALNSLLSSLRANDTTGSEPPSSHYPTCGRVVELSEKDEVRFEVDLRWKRQLSLAGSDEGSLTCARVLSAQEKHLLAAHITQLSKGLPAAGGGKLGMVLNGAFPKFIRIPSEAGAPAVPLVGRVYWWHELQNISLSLNAGSPSTSISTTSWQHQWWTARQANNDSSTFATTDTDGLQVVVGAEKLAGGSAASSFTAGGILGFYVVVVYAIGRAVRSACGGTRYRLIFDEMPEVHDVRRRDSNLHCPPPAVPSEA